MEMFLLPGHQNDDGLAVTQYSLELIFEATLGKLALAFKAANFYLPFGILRMIRFPPVICREITITKKYSDFNDTSLAIFNPHMLAKG